MKTTAFLTYLTSLIVATSALLTTDASALLYGATNLQDDDIVFDENDIDFDDEFQFDGNEIAFDEVKNVETLEKIFAEFNRAAREEGVDGLNAFYFANRRNKALTPATSRFFAESLCAVTINELGKKATLKEWRNSTSSRLDSTMRIPNLRRDTRMRRPDRNFRPKICAQTSPGLATRLR